MAILGGLGKDTVDKIDKETLPEISAEAKALLSQVSEILHGIVDRFAGARITITIDIPPKK